MEEDNNNDNDSNIQDINNWSLDQVLERARNTGEFPPLYRKERKTGKYRFWKISIETYDDGTASILTKYGIYGSPKIQTKYKHIQRGKNIGRTNQTTPYQQAIKEALSRFNGKMKSMTYNVEDLKKDILRIFPMLAKDYSKLPKSSRMRFPCDIQVKFDGVRCLAKWDANANKIIMLGRDQNLIVNMPHIEKELYECAKRIGFDENFYFDGELYRKGIPLQTINGIVNRTININLHNNLIERERIKYFIYDCFFVDKLKEYGFRARSDFLMKLLTNQEGNDIYNSLVYVNSFIIHSESEMIEWTNKFIKMEFEGSILRKSDGKYKPGHSKSSGRSNDLQKYKEEKMESAYVIDLEEKKHVKGFGFVFICRHEKTGKSFKMNANGSVEYKKQVFLNKDQYINRKIRYKFTEVTKDNIPRYPVPILDNDKAYVFEGGYEGPNFLQGTSLNLDMPTFMERDEDIEEGNENDEKNYDFYLNDQ
jgi:hypothetical protein